ncbi:MAG: hypothetical protein J2P57_21725, partial [Acidimicrobiaceae bacterium]|nr:hypothetical protein [Acidimicrobiaceae bacterium]
MILLSLLAVPLVIGIAASLTRRAWWDKRAADRHHNAIEVLGRITREQAEINGATPHVPVEAYSDPSDEARAGLRVISTGASELTPRRGVAPSHARNGDEAPAEMPAQPPGPPPSRLPPPAAKDVPLPPTRPAV